MVQQNGKVSGGKPPISKHPLFPAIVALWFGALFGLGSLAVRPGLFESVVISSGLDTLVPAAAPPLGMTARVLIAVILAAIGGVLGAVIGRRIGRDKPVEYVRRRGADRPERALADTDVDEPVAREGGSLRRRSLAISEDEEQFSVYEAAPLPGGSPGILDVTAVDIDASAIAPDAEFSRQPEAPASLRPAAEAVPPMELTEIAAEMPAASFAPSPVMPASSADADTAAGARAFDRPMPAPEPAAFTPPLNAPGGFAPAAHEPFQPASIALEQFAPEPAPRFAPPQPVANDLPSAQHPATPSPLVLETARPIDFSQPAFQRAEGYSPMPEAVAESEVPPMPPAAVAPERLAEPVPFQAAAPVAVPAPFVVPAPAPAPFPTVLGEGDIKRITDAELDTLSPVELVERLAISIQQRRKARLAASSAAAATAVASTFTAEPVEAERTEAEASSTAEVLPEAAPIPVAYAPPPALESSPVAAASPAAPFIPAALRPLSLDPVDEADDLDFIPIPPRHIAMAQTQPMFTAESETAGFAEPEPAAPETGENDDVPEEAYSSLLDLGRPADPRPNFVRIDAPEAEVAAPEPVVIFPGQTAQPAYVAPAVPTPYDSSFAAPTAGGADNGARRFDAPGQSTGVPTSFAAPPPLQQDPAETEQALRNALANLQRMSGAA